MFTITQYGPLKYRWICGFSIHDEMRVGVGRADLGVHRHLWLELGRHERLRDPKRGRVISRAVRSWPTSAHETKAVKSQAPKGWGLYDVLGNVYEWAWDRYDQSPSGGTEPQRTATGIYRVFRGGTWAGDAGSIRAAFRLGRDAGFRASGWGFRLARTLP